MHMLLVKFHSGHDDQTVSRLLDERLPLFRAVPGLVQKYYAREESSGDYVGCYLFESKQALLDYRASDLAKSIPPTYAIEGAPRVEMLEILFPLR
jgi:hypothetical protein